MERCRLVEFPGFSDASGQLTYVEAERHVPFAARRIYYLYQVPKGSRRGAHAHRELQQCLVAVHGSFDVIIDDGRQRDRRRLSRPGQGLCMGALVWREIENFSPGAVCLVLASAWFDERDYIRDYDEFLRLTSRVPP